MLFIPDVTGQDYDNLRMVMGACLPDSYNEWINLCCLLANKRGRSGFVLVPFRLSAFVNYAFAGGRAPDLNTLLEYCATKGAPAQAA